MPLLKDLSCSIELSEDQEPLQELGTTYGDAIVETFIPIPKKQQKFTVHLSSKNFIAPGIAMYVFIDGVYQCNRNKQNLKLRKPPDSRSLVDFKVRQKEERQKDGSMIAREWTFEKLDHASVDDESCSPNILDNIGCIEVVVLRCAGPRNARTAANMNLDGATDYPDYRFDRHSRSRTTARDDRSPFASASRRSQTPPPIPYYRSPHAETVRSREPMQKAYSRYSEPVSPGTRPQVGIPAPAFQYGSGPLPPYAKGHDQRDLSDEAMPNHAPKSGATVDPDMLEKIVTDAVKRGVEESRRKDMSNRTVGRDDEHDRESSSQIPGAWPTSPTPRSKRRSHESASYKRHGRDDDRRHRSHARGRSPSRSRAETRVAWDEEPGWDKQSRADEWALTEDDAADSWDTDGTWSKRRPHGWKEGRYRSRFRGRIDRSPSRQRSKHGRSRSKAHSRWTGGSRSSLADNDGWTRVEAPSDSSTCRSRSDSTLQPSHSRSQVQPPRSKSSRRSSRRRSSRSHHERRLSQLVENPHWHPESVYHARPPSVLVTNAPTILSAPISRYPADARSQPQSIYTQPAPPPTWGCASEKARKNSAATSYFPPAPFSTVGVDRHENSKSDSSSSWGVAGEQSLNEKKEKEKEKERSSAQRSTWGEDKESDKARKTWGEADDQTMEWKTGRGQEWGGDDAFVQTEGAWNGTEKDDGWGVSNSTKDAAAHSWDTENNGNNDNNWGLTDIKGGETGGWNTDPNNTSWEQNDTSKDEQNNAGAFFGEDDVKTGWNTEQNNNNTSWDQPQNSTLEGAFKPDATWAPAAEAETSHKTDEKAKSAPARKRHTSKSLTKYRQPSTPTRRIPSHFKFPPPRAPKTLRPLPVNTNASDKASDIDPAIPSVPAERLHKFTPSTLSSLARKKGVQHQVLAGPGMQYDHALNRPMYLDSLDAPYAVFRFQYRSRDVLRGLFGKECLGESVRMLREEGEEEMGKLSRADLIGRVVKLRRRLDGNEKVDEGEEKSRCTESVALGRAVEWVKAHSGAPLEKEKMKEEQGVREMGKALSAERVAGWDDGGAKWNGKAVVW